MEAMLKHAQDVLRMEAEAILELVPRVDENFAAAVKLILDCQGRTVITGMGKSGLIGRKMAATFASTGTPTAPSARYTSEAMAESLEPSTTAASVMAKVCMVMGTPRGIGMEIWAITAMTAANRPA